MMTKSPICNRKWKIGIVFFQVIFLSAQFLLFYPCIVNAPSIRNAAEGDPNTAKFQTHIDQQAAPGPNAQVDIFGSVNEKGKYLPTWESLDSRPNPTWYDDAKIGIFLHWGVYSVPSFVDVGNKGLAEWFWYYWSGGNNNGKIDEQAQENIKSVQKFMKKNYPPGFKYTDFAPLMTAEFFNPDHWAQLFEASGARYVVLTSKHHDGFALWPSARSWNWNSVDNGPHRDIIGELSEAVRERNIHFGLYHSLYEWFNPLYLHDKQNNYSTQVYVKDKLMPELTELVLKYKPDIVWGDGDWEAPCSYWNCTNFLAWLYNDSPNKEQVVSNDRWGPDVRCNHSSFLTCDDRWEPDSSMNWKWENCMTIDKESWGYRRNAEIQDYYTIEELIDILSRTVSKGGNLLMNIGPTADGRIIPVFQERLLQLGEWLKLNGDAIYGTRPWKFSSDPLNNDVRYTSKNVGGKKIVYAIILKYPQKETFRLGAPVSDVSTKVTWVGFPSPLKWSSAGVAGIDITIPRLLLSEIPCQWAWVFKLEGLKN